MCDSLIASVVIRLLFIRCIKSTRNSSKLTAVVFSAGSPTTSNSDTIQYLPDLSSLFVMAVPCCVFSSKGPSLSLSLSLFLSLSLPLAFVAEMCYQPLTSPPSLQKLRTDRLFFPLQIPGSGPTNPFKKGKIIKKGQKGKEKENVTKMRESLEMYPRFLQVKKQPPLSGSVVVAYRRPICVHIHTLIQT